MCVCVGGRGNGVQDDTTSGEGRKPPTTVPRFLPFYIKWYRAASTLTGSIQLFNHTDNGGSIFGCWKSTGSYQQVNWALRSRLEGKRGVTRISDNALAITWQSHSWFLTLNLLTWRIWWAPNNASKWQMGFNSSFKGLTLSNSSGCYMYTQVLAENILHYAQRMYVCDLYGS